MSSESTPSKFCWAPFVGVAVWPHGQIRPCCVSTLDLEPFTETSSLMDSWQGQAMKDLRSELSEGQAGKGCENCYLAEEQGRISKRMKFERRLKKSGALPRRDSFSPSVENLKFAEIVFSNACNLKCLMCNSRYSTKWFKDDQELVGRGLRDPDLLSFQKPFRASIDIGELFRVLKNVETIEILGGEPLIEKACIEFLAQAKKEIPKTEIVLVSNLIELPNEVVSAVKENKKIVINCSIDGVGQVYEFIRGASFSKLEGNLERLLSVASPRSLDFHFTVSAMNLPIIGDVISWAEALQVKFPETKLRLLFDQVVSDPIYLHPKVYSILAGNGYAHGLSPLPHDSSLCEPNDLLKLRDILASRLEIDEKFLMDLFMAYADWIQESRGLSLPPFFEPSKWPDRSKYTSAKLFG